jgi:hypothetical protein
MAHYQAFASVGVVPGSETHYALCYFNVDVATYVWDQLSTSVLSSCDLLKPNSYYGQSAKSIVWTRDRNPVKGQCWLDKMALLICTRHAW